MPPAALALLVALASGAALPPPARQAADLLADPSYQRALPAEDHPSPPPPWLVGLLDLAGWAALAAAVVAAGLGAAWLVGRLARPRVKDLALPEAGPGAPLEVPLEDARALAAAGRYDEAIHALLLATLAALARATRLAPSLTSREVLARVRLAAAPREALGGLVRAVELSRFGGEPATEADFGACLDRFQAFLDTYRSAA